MASRRMRIKAVAKVPSLGKPRQGNRPTTPLCGYAEPSSPAPNTVSGTDESRASPKTPVQLLSPIGYPPSPTQKVLNAPTDDRVFSLNSPGLMSPKSPHSCRSSHASAPASPMPVTSVNPESPRRPTTPLTPNSFHGENSQDKIMSPVYSPSYSAFSPGMGPGITVAIQRVPTPKSPALAISPAAMMSEDSNSSVASSSLSLPSRPPKGKSQKRPPPFSQTNTSQSKSALKEALSSGTSLISAALNNSETLRQRLQKGAAHPSPSKYAMIRKDYLAKYQNKVPDPKDLTMLHYAFFNPPKSETSRESGSDSNGEIGKGVEKPAAKRRRRTDSRDSVASSLSVISNPPPPNEVEPESDDAASQPVGPRVKVGPDGQLIIDEQSLFIETSHSQRAKKQLAEMETVSGSSFIVGSSGIYSRKKPLKRGIDWDEKETMKFYKALITCGTDFSMMATVFKGTRTRSELKAKFKREDRRNPQQVSRALSKQCFDPTLALTDSDDEEAVLDDCGDVSELSKDSDSNDIENVSNSPRKRKDEIKKTLQSLKKKGELSKPAVPPVKSMPFCRPGGKIDWHLYNVMQKKLAESKSAAQDERDVYEDTSGPAEKCANKEAEPIQRNPNARKKTSEVKSGKKGPKILKKVLGFDSNDPLGLKVVADATPSTSNLSVPCLDLEPPINSSVPPSLESSVPSPSAPPLVNELSSFTLVSLDAGEKQRDDDDVDVNNQKTVQDPVNSMGCVPSTPTSEISEESSARTRNEDCVTTCVSKAHCSEPSIPLGSSSIESSAQSYLENIRTPPADIGRGGSNMSETVSIKHASRTKVKPPFLRIPGPGAFSDASSCEKSTVEEIEIEITCT